MCWKVYPHQGAMLDKLVEEQKNGHEVFWAYCQGALSSCFPNVNGNKATCEFCNLMNREFSKLYTDKKVHIIPIDRRFFKNNEKQNFNYSTIEDIKKIKYRDVEVGKSILSVFISGTRDLDIEINQSFRIYFNQLAQEICDYTDYLYNLIEHIKPDEMIVQNGRLFEHRMFYDIAMKKGIHFVSVEVVGGYGEPYKRVSFDGTLPHSIANRTRIMNEVWKKSEDSEAEKERIGANFYEKRRGGELIADLKAYTANQTKGLLPEGFDSRKHNVTIFNSSTDEVAAIGGEWDEDKLFDSQYDAIEFILQNAPHGMHFYLRIHPNMEKVTYHDHLGLYNLPQKYDNITVIEPKSKISSYALLDACEKVIVFGSTMGVEACYWGKPSILIGKAFYYGLDVCYKPKSKDEIIDLLSKELQAKNKYDSIKYAYYLLDRKYQVEQKKYVEYNIQEKKVLGIKYRYVPYFRIFNSTILYKIIYSIYHRLFEVNSKIAYKYPSK